MFKATPNPPLDTDPTEPSDQPDPVSPYASVDSKKLHDAAHRALDFYLNPSPEKPRNSVDRGMQMFKVDPEINPEAIAIQTYETFSSVSILLLDLADSLDDKPGRQAAASGDGDLSVE